MRNTIKYLGLTTSAQGINRIKYEANTATSLTSVSKTGVDGDSLKVSARDIDGTRFYYGVNADWQLARDWRLYAKFEREKGNDFSEDYDVSVGFKYAF